MDFSPIFRCRPGCPGTVFRAKTKAERPRIKPGHSAGCKNQKAAARCMGLLLKTGTNPQGPGTFAANKGGQNGRAAYSPKTFL